jgi:hypothetical protein
LCPVENVVSSESVDVPGYETPITKKTSMGDLYVSKFTDNRMTAPPERYYREDHRLPKKIKGLYVCDPAPDGKHGDTFDSGKLASRAVNGSDTGMQSTAGIRIGMNPARLKFKPRARL